jgi:hypothetical protein
VNATNGIRSKSSLEKPLENLEKEKELMRLKGKDISADSVMKSVLTGTH